MPPLPHCRKPKGRCWDTVKHYSAAINRVHNKNGYDSPGDDEIVKDTIRSKIFVYVLVRLFAYSMNTLKSVLSSAEGKIHYTPPPHPIFFFAKRLDVKYMFLVLIFCQPSTA